MTEVQHFGEADGEQTGINSRRVGKKPGLLVAAALAAAVSSLIPNDVKATPWAEQPQNASNAGLKPYIDTPSAGKDFRVFASASSGPGSTDILYSTRENGGAWKPPVKLETCTPGDLYKVSEDGLDESSAVYDKAHGKLYVDKFPDPSVFDVTFKPDGTVCASNGTPVIDMMGQFATVRFGDSKDDGSIIILDGDTAGDNVRSIYQYETSGGKAATKILNMGGGALSKEAPAFYKNAAGVRDESQIAFSMKNPADPQSKGGYDIYVASGYNPAASAMGMVATHLDIPGQTADDEFMGRTDENGDVCVARIGAGNSTIDCDPGVTIVQPTPGINVAEEPADGSLDVTEGGANDKLIISLKSKPTGLVTITFTNADGQVMVAPLTFDQNSWDTPQKATIVAVDDPDNEQSPQQTNLIATASSSDPAYNGKTFQKTVNVYDNDPSGTGGGAGSGGMAGAGGMNTGANGGGGTGGTGGAEGGTGGTGGTPEGGSGGTTMDIPIIKLPNGCNVDTLPNTVIQRTKETVATDASLCVASCEKGKGTLKIQNGTCIGRFVDSEGHYLDTPLSTPDGDNSVFSVTVEGNTIYLPDIEMDDFNNHHANFTFDTRDGNEFALTGTMGGIVSYRRFITKTLGLEAFTPFFEKAFDEMRTARTSFIYDGSAQLKLEGNPLDDSQLYHSEVTRTPDGKMGYVITNEGKFVETNLLHQSWGPKGCNTTPDSVISDTRNNMGGYGDLIILGLGAAAALARKKR